MTTWDTFALLCSLQMLVGLCWLSLFGQNFFEIKHPFTLKNHAVHFLSTLVSKSDVKSKAFHEPLNFFASNWIMVEIILAYWWQAMCQCLTMILFCVELYLSD